MLNLNNRPSILWDLLNKKKNNMDQFKVSDEEFFNLVTAYKLQDGTVTLAQLKEAAANTRAPEVVLQNFGLYEEVYGGTEVKDEVEVKVKDEVKTKPLSQMNKTELTAAATLAGIALTGKETNKKIAELIIEAAPPQP